MLRLVKHSLIDGRGGSMQGPDWEHERLQWEHGLDLCLMSLVQNWLLPLRSNDEIGRIACDIRCYVCKANA